MINMATPFPKALEELLNCYSKESESDTPDFVLAEFLQGCLNAFNLAIRHRRSLCGEEPDQNVVPNGELEALRFIAERLNRLVACQTGSVMLETPWQKREAMHNEDTA